MPTYDSGMKAALGEIERAMSTLTTDLERDPAPELILCPECGKNEKPVSVSALSLSCNVCGATIYMDLDASRHGATNDTDVAAAKTDSPFSNFANKHYLSELKTEANV